MLHLLPRSILVALLRVLVWIGAPDSLQIDVWAAIRAHEIAEERAWVETMCSEICAYPARGGAA